MGTLSDFLDALPEDGWIADLIFGDEGVVCGFVFWFDDALAGHCLEDHNAEYGSYKTARISHRACHRHAVGLIHTVRIDLKESLLGGTEHRRVRYGSGKKTHRVRQCYSACPVRSYGQQ